MCSVLVSTGCGVDRSIVPYYVYNLQYIIGSTSSSGSVEIYWMRWQTTHMSPVSEVSTNARFYLQCVTNTNTCLRRAAGAIIHNSSITLQLQICMVHPFTSPYLRNISWMVLLLCSVHCVRYEVVGGDNSVKWGLGIITSPGLHEAWREIMGNIQYDTTRCKRFDWIAFIYQDMLPLMFLLNQVLLSNSIGLMMWRMVRYGND